MSVTPSSSRLQPGAWTNGVTPFLSQHHSHYEFRPVMCKVLVCEEGRTPNVITRLSFSRASNFRGSHTMRRPVSSTGPSKR